MQSIYQQLCQNFQEALTKIVPSDMGPVDPMIRKTSDSKFGNYQSNVAMSLAKKLKKSPRDVAAELIEAVNLDGLCDKTEIAGPGFINLFVSTDCLSVFLTQVQEDERLGVPKVQKPIQHVIDFSSPNLAKEMHVGHLRTTITGEVIARIIEFQGHSIERVNHVGDWGTQFGMLLQYIYENHPEVVKDPDGFRVSDLETFYKAAKTCFDQDEEFADRARKKVVLLQSGDETAQTLWKAFLKESLRHCHEIYDRLNVTLEDVGESFYNDRLAGVVQELLERGEAVNSEGAVCVFLEGFTNRDGDPLPMIVQKSDGGYNYSTTDCAALKYRVNEQKGRRLIYVTDLRQAQHFAMLFALARKVGWAPESVQLNHIGYGMVLGADKKPFKTRDGGTVRLKDLLEESVNRAEKVVQENMRGFSEEKTRQVANAVGLAAIKYSDLSHNLSSDYVFSWDKMLAMEGNTGPYMLYAYARIRSIGRKGHVDLDGLNPLSEFVLDHPKEKDLAFVLSRFADVLAEAGEGLKPSILTDYLFDVSKAFSSFYDKKHGVSVLEAKTPEQKDSRLALCGLTARTIRLVLGLLSIDVVEEM